MGYEITQGLRMVSGACAAKLITSTMATTVTTATTASTGGWGTSGRWFKLKVISSKAVFSQIIAPGIDGDTLFTSGTSFALGAEITCNKITRVNLSTKTTGHKVLAYKVFI
jgi:hypothetical protein